MPKLDLTTATRIKVAGGEVLALKGQGFAWARASVEFDPITLGIPFGSADAIGLPADSPIDAWPDEAGLWNDWTQSSNAQRPILRTDGVKWWAEFDGVDDVLGNLSAQSYFNAQPAAQLFLAYRLNTAGWRALILPTISSAATVLFSIGGTAARIETNARRSSSDSLQTYISSSVDCSVDHVASTSIDHADQTYYQRYNGNLVGSGPTNLTQGGFAGVGSFGMGMGGANRSSSTSSVGMRVYAWAISNRILSEVEAASLVTWMKNKAGVA